MRSNSNPIRNTLTMPRKTSDPAINGKKARPKPPLGGPVRAVPVPLLFVVVVVVVAVADPVGTLVGV